MFTDNSQRFEMYTSVHHSLSPKIKQFSKSTKKREYSPYTHLNSVFTMADRSKAMSKSKKPRVNLSALQGYFFEFQEKSKILLKQLEKNVLG